MTEPHCSVEKCKRSLRAKTYCDRHYRSWRRGELSKPRYKICKSENCRKPMIRRGFCEAHYESWKTTRKRAVRLIQPTDASAPAAPAAS